jgi:MscS family membrane protein
MLAFVSTSFAQTDTVTGDYNSATSAVAQQVLTGAPRFQPALVDSPRATLESFVRLSHKLEEALLAYNEDQNRINADRFSLLLLPQLLQLLDLSSLPEAARREIGVDTLAYLLDIIGRLELPPMDEIPDAEAFDGDTLAKWRIPHSPIWITRVEDGPRKGEFLFSQATIDTAPWFFQRIQYEPLRTLLGIESWHKSFPQLYGPMIPAGFVQAIPGSLKHTLLDTPVWKIFAVLMLIALAILLLTLWHRFVNLVQLKGGLTNSIRNLLTPVAVILVAYVLHPFIAFEVNVSGRFAQAFDYASTLVIYLTVAWIFWLLVLALFEWIILSPKIADQGLNAHLLRLVARVIGFVGSVLILAYAAQATGVPVFGIVAGLGVGGLAVALAIQPTLENLISGAILYMDRPVRVGDFCGFGDKVGTVENIGVRSTQIRALDQTLISVPNSKFVSMEIINWDKCDKMLIRTTIGLLYQTESDQLRYVLARLREMFYAHPKIDSDTVRVRFVGYGSSSLDVEIFVYALTKDWDAFYAIQEDVFLRVKDIVGESGTRFAFPSRTIYTSDGLDKEQADAATRQVQSWRESGELPFPKMTAAEIGKLADTGDYPPRGSPGAGKPEAQG